MKISKKNIFKVASMFVFLGASALTLASCGGNDVEYKLDKETDTYTLVKYNEGDYDSQKDFKIPSTYNGKKVTKIGNKAFEKCVSLKTITIPDSIVEIEEDAFLKCNVKKINVKNLETWCNIKFVAETSNPLYYDATLYVNNVLVTDLVIPSTVTQLNDYAFLDCDGLLTAQIHSGVTTVGKSVFKDCDSLYAINSEHTSRPAGWDKEWNPDRIAINWNSNNSVFEKDGISYVVDGSEATIVKYRGKNTTATIPSSVELSSNTYTVTAIGDYAFAEIINESDIVYGYTRISKVIIPETVKTIGKGSFQYCKDLNNLSLPNGLEEIGTSAFQYCSSIKILLVPNTVTKMGVDVFKSCSNIKIYCNFTEQPSGWVPSWNSDKTNTYWYSETEPAGDAEGNYWHYVNNKIVIW